MLIPKVLSILKNLQSSSHEGAACRSLSLPSIDIGEVKLDVYEPNDGKCAATVMLIHGMNKWGPKDPRIVDMCYALSKVGYRIVVPEIPHFMQHVIAVEHSCDYMAGIIKAVTDDNLICPDKRVGVIGISLAGTLSMYTATRPDVSRLVSALFFIAMPYDPPITLIHALCHPKSDPFAKYIILKNLLMSRPDTPDWLIEALEARIQDDYDDTDQKAFERYCEKLDDKQAELVRQTVNIDYDTCKETYYDDYQNFFKTCADTHNMSDIKAKVLILHSDMDEVFDVKDSIQFHKDLKASGVDAKLAITSMLGDHANFKLNLKNIKNLIDVVLKFRFFLKALG